MSNSIIAEGRTTNEAIEKGLKELNAKRDDVIINIIGNEEKRSFFSILEPTKIKVELILKNSIKSKKDDITDEELDNVLKIMEKFTYDFFGKLNINELEIKLEKKDNKIYINVNGKDINHLIGYRGETLNCLQLIFSNVANKQLKNKCTVILDIENYREKRKVVLEELAEKISKTVIKNKKKIELEPMSAYERKIIHTKLQNNSKVKTYSVGEEPNRRIVVDLK